MDTGRVEELGSAILHWLCFQNLCGRAPLLSESYLSQPIGEFLLHHHSGSLDSEVMHPSLQKTGGKGRPRQIDFCLHSRDTGRLTTALELKWASSAPGQRQAVVDDILRLEALRIPEGQHVYRYLLVAGLQDKFKSNVRYAKSNLGRGRGRVEFFPEFLSFSDYSDYTVEIGSLSEPQRAASDSFSRYYESPLPRRFVTTLVYGKTQRGFTVYIWRVRSAKSRRTIPVPAAA